MHELLTNLEYFKLLSYCLYAMISLEIFLANN
jgi:hypothetical protein